MQWIPEYLKKNVTESNDNQTLYIDLPKNEQISFIQVEVSAQYASIDYGTTTLIGAIDKYEVIADGSKVLYSLEPELAYYIDFVTNDGLYPPMGFSCGPSYRDTHQFIIPFGRYPYDEEYMLDTSLYNNVQLRIPYDISDTDYFSAGSFRTNILMYRPLEKLTPTGIIRSRCVRKETTTEAIQTISHDLPMTYPLRYVAVRVDDEDQNISTVMTGVKVNIDEGRLILLDLNDNEWLDADKRRYPEKNYYEVFGAFVDAQEALAYVDYPVPISIVSSASIAIFYRLGYTKGERLRLNLYNPAGETITGAYALGVKVGGANPHSCVTLIDGRDQPFDVRGYTEGKVEYTQAAYITTYHTFVQEVVSGALT